MREAILQRHLHPELAVNYNMRDYTAFWEILGSSSRSGGCQLFFLGFFFCYSFFFSLSLFLPLPSFFQLSILSGFLAAIDF